MRSAIAIACVILAIPLVAGVLWHDPWPAAVGLTAMLLLAALCLPPSRESPRRQAEPPADCEAEGDPFLPFRGRGG